MLHSGELRPRQGASGVYETDFVSFTGSSVDQYGSTLINIPTADSDGNGLPDFCQRDKAANSTFTWTSHLDWPSSMDVAGNGVLNRSPGQVSGQVYLTITTPGVTLSVSQFTWEVLSYAGTFRYTRGAANSGTWDITMTDSSGAVTHFSATVPFTVINANQITIPQFTAYGTTAGSSGSVVVYASTFSRSGNRYIGTVTLQDGTPRTYWRDYGDWVFVITDNNDSNLNGVPDLSDAALCTFSLPVTFASIGSSGGTQSFALTSPGACAWTALSSQTWLRTASSGSGSGTISYTVDANPNYSERSGTISVGGQSFTLAQAGKPQPALHPASVPVSAAGARGSFTITTSGSWTAVPNAAWLHTTSLGYGNGTVSYAVDAHPGTLPRVGTITVAGLTFTVAQGGHGPARPRLDFNSDGTDDLVFQNGTGALTTWLMNGQGQALSGKAIYNGNLGDWKLVALADVNSDGKTDLILQNTPGQIVAWLMNGQGQPTTGVTIYSGNLGDWRIVAAADLNTDGQADLVFQNAAGQVVGWFMDGQGHPTTGITIYGSSIDGWKVATMGDVNGDGIADLLWQTPLGSVVAWLMDGQGHSTIGVTLYGGTLAGWRIAGMKDMDGDGIGDLVWQSTSGSVLAWLMDGNSHPTVALNIYSSSLYDWLVH